MKLIQAEEERSSNSLKTNRSNERMIDFYEYNQRWQNIIN